MRPAARWLTVALYVNAIFWTIPYQRSLSRAVLGADLGRWTLAGGGILFALVVLGLALGANRSRSSRRNLAAVHERAGTHVLRRAVPDRFSGARGPRPRSAGRRPDRRGGGSAGASGPPLRAVAACAFAYAGLVWYLSAVPDEVVHLAEYGLLAMLLWWALSGAGVERAPRLAVAAAAGIGLVDEVLQGVTPGRFFDWRDVFANFASGLLPLWLLRGGGRWSIS